MSQLPIETCKIKQHETARCCSRYFENIFFPRKRVKHMFPSHCLLKRIKNTNLVLDRIVFALNGNITTIILSTANVIVILQKIRNMFVILYFRSENQSNNSLFRRCLSNATRPLSRCYLQSNLVKNTAGAHKEPSKKYKNNLRTLKSKHLVLCS